MKSNYLAPCTFLLSLLFFSCTSHDRQIEWVSMTEDSLWQMEAAPQVIKAGQTADIVIDTSQTAQTISGFGACFNEMGVSSLSMVAKLRMDSVMMELFLPGYGANLTYCRLPIGANDFAMDWYSFDEAPGDFALDSFSIMHDNGSLIPFINSAKKFAPGLKLWASPWSPPVWMKKNNHYAMASTAVRAKEFAKIKKENGGVLPEALESQAAIDNGLPESKQGYEGTDQFIMEDKYLQAYANYFGKFIDGYKALGIDITAVMPQNEFNSAQIFPSCCWTAKGLATFVGKYLGPAMQSRGVKVFFGTMERPDAAMVDTILQDPDCAKYVEGVGFQWAGKDALPAVHKKYPQLLMIQSEQECGDGKNDWNGVLHSWDLMKHYLNNGVSLYDYWNISLTKDKPSHWGWMQNSLVVVAYDGSYYRYTPEYYLLKLHSHYVLPGAKKLEGKGDYKNYLSFLNRDGSIVVVVANEEDQPKRVTILVDGKVYAPRLKPHSFNTLLFR